MLALRQRSAGLRACASAGPQQLLHVWSLRPKSGKKSHKLGHPDIGRAERPSQDCGGRHTVWPRPGRRRGRAAPCRTAQEGPRTRYNPPQPRNPRCLRPPLTSGPQTDMTIMRSIHGPAQTSSRRRSPRQTPSCGQRLANLTPTRRRYYSTPSCSVRRTAVASKSSTAGLARFS